MSVINMFTYIEKKVIRHTNQTMDEKATGGGIYLLCILL